MSSIKKELCRCALCGDIGDLSFEHIPPRKAFNDRPVKVISGESMLTLAADNSRSPWDFSGLSYINAQKGKGLYSLCSKCNSFTGANYGQAYIDFARGFANIVSQEHLQPNSVVNIHCANIKPLNIIKQVSSLFCSVNNIKGNRNGIDPLRKFVLDKNSQFFPSEELKLCFYIFAGGMERQCGITALGSKAGVIVVSEIVAFPLGFVLYFNTNNADSSLLTDISYFSNYKFNEVVSVDISVPVLECNTIFPLDYRSKEEIEDTIKENEMLNNFL